MRTRKKNIALKLTILLLIFLATAINSQETNEINDHFPPTIEVFSPNNYFMYGTKEVLLNASFNENVTVYYKDNLQKKIMWKKLANNTISFSKILIFNEGNNDITIKAVDNFGNFAVVQGKFLVDIDKPRIFLGKEKNFLNGNFSVKFIEDYPESLIFYYGNNKSGEETSAINIKRKCYLINRAFSCNLNVNLEKYDGEEIEYWFKLTNLVNNSQESKVMKGKVDFKAPIINNPDSLLRIKGKSIVFEINITEPNFKGAYYLDNSLKKPSWKTICIRLSNGICKKMQSIKSGEHSFDIKIIDDNGNFIIKKINFEV